MAVEDSEENMFSRAFSARQVRLGFLRKVYSILMVQVAVTTLMVAGFAVVPALRAWAVANTSLQLLAFVMLFVMMLVLVCCEGVRRSYPANYIFLGLFTLAQAFLLGCIAAATKPSLVLLALTITAVLCLALTLFAMQTSIDFTLWSGALYIMLCILMLAGFILIFLPFKPLHLVYSIAGAAIFSFYILIDTQLMLTGRYAYTLSPEDYVFAALNLYLDMVNLFLMILRILAILSDDS